jgi:hypothetical protein
LTEDHGFVASDVGSHELVVGALDMPVTITRADLPEMSLTADPAVIASGESSDLEWTDVGGTFINSTMSWGIDTSSAPSGIETVFPPDTRPFVLNSIFEEGGAVAAATVYVDEVPSDLIFADDFEEGDLDDWFSVTP